MAGRYKPTHQKKKRRAKRKESSFLRTALTLCFCVLAFVFSAFLWREALRVSSQEQGSVSASGEAFRPQVGDPPYRVAPLMPGMAATTRAQGEWWKKKT